MEYSEDVFRRIKTSQWDRVREAESGDDLSITRGKVTEAVKQHHGGMAHGVDKVHPEVLMALDVVRFRLTCLCNVALRSGVVPLNWQTGVVVPIFKKGDLRVCSNYDGDHAH